MADLYTRRLQRIYDEVQSPKKDPVDGALQEYLEKQVAAAIVGFRISVAELAAWLAFEGRHPTAISVEVNYDDDHYARTGGFVRILVNEN